MAEKAIVLGASGDQGIPLVSRLLDAGFSVTAGTRREGALANTPFPDLPTIAASLLDQASLEQAFKGQDVLAMHLPFEHDLAKAVAFGRNISNAAKAAELKKIVFNSSCYVADRDLEITAHDGRRSIQKSIVAGCVHEQYDCPLVQAVHRAP